LPETKKLDSREGFMNTLSIPVVAMASISFYVGLYHLLIYIRRPQYREDLTFAFLCFANVFYDAFCVGLYNATSVVEGSQWQRAQFIALAVFVLAFLWFISDYTHQKPGKVIYIYSIYYILVVIVQLADRSNLTFLVDQPSIKHIVLSHVLTITYYEVTPGLFSVVQGLVGMVASTYILIMGIRYVKRGHKREAMPLILAMGFIYAAGFNDTMVSNGVYQLVYLIEYAYLAVILVMAYSLSSTVVDAAIAKDALRKSEERFRSLVETTSDWVWEVDSNGIYTYASPKIYELLGYEPKEIIGKTPIDLMPPEEAERIGAIFRNIADSQAPFERLENAALHKDGRLVVLETNGVPFFDANGELLGYRGIDRDITERKHTEEVVRESEHRFRTLAEASFEGIGLSKQGVLLDLNDQLAQMLGYRREELLGTSVTNYVAPEHRELVAGFMKDNRQEPYEHLALRKDGTIFPVEIRVRTIRIGDTDIRITAIRDITERKRTEEALKQYTQQLQQRAEQLATMNEIGRAVSSLRDLDSVLEIIYHQVQRVVQVDAFYIGLYDSEHELITFPLMYDRGRRYDEQALPLVESPWLAGVIHTGKPFVFHRTMDELQLPLAGRGLGDLRRKSASILIAPLWRGERVIGAISTQSYTMNAYTDEHAEILTGIGHQAAIAIGNAQLYEQAQQEIVERRRVQAEREQLIADLEAKNAELEQFTYTISHDLKSPLITIRGFLGFIEQDANSGNTGRLHTDIQRVSEATDKMQVLLYDLLELSRIGRLMNEPETIPFADLVRDAMDNVHGQLEARGITVTLQPNLPAVYGDHQRLVEVLQNLLDNAAKFMGNQTNPRIEIGQRGEDAERGEPVFFIKDNGIGIAPEHHERIFGLFNQLDPKMEGTGVGLALVKRIVEFHEGRIWVESEGPDRGSTFLFTLPRGST
jgi:PAS domain S-box-containing protein